MWWCRPQGHTDERSAHVGKSSTHFVEKMKFEAGPLVPILSQGTKPIQTDLNRKGNLSALAITVRVRGLLLGGCSKDIVRNVFGISS